MRSSIGSSRTLAFFALGFLLNAQRAQAVDLGQVGQVYPIAEPDALEEVEQRAARIRWDDLLTEGERRRLIEGYRPKDLAALPRAQEDRTRTIDFTYTLDVDLPDGKGGVLYPKGYTFNPLYYVAYPNVLVFLDGDDPEQISWFRSSTLAAEPRTRLVLTGGSYAELSRELRKPVFYLTSPLRDRFRLEAVPAVAYQEGEAMTVREFDVSKPKATAERDARTQAKPETGRTADEKK